MQLSSSLAAMRRREILVGRERRIPSQNCAIDPKSEPEVSLEDFVDNGDSDYTPAVLTGWREIPSESLERKELRETLRRAVNELPEKYREVLISRDVREMNIAETAELLGISEGVVKTRLFRARLMMQKIVAPELRAQGKRYTKG
jgi:RNA polymerase sigma factor (sigma-70 family)